MCHDMSLFGIGVVVAITSARQCDKVMPSSAARQHTTLIDEDDSDAMYRIFNKYRVKSAFDPTSRYILNAPLN